MLQITSPLFAQQSEEEKAAARAALAIGAEEAAAAFRVPDGLIIEVFADEALLSNPISFCLDEKGRIYVTESNRIERGVTDNRQHMYWLHDDLAAKRVEDRLAMYKKWKHKFDGGLDWFSAGEDRIVRITDTDGDGRADKSQVFVDGFNDALDGLGSGVIARDGDIYYTQIPHLYLLKDTDGDGKADVQKSLHRGYGVRMSFFGHDMHGLVWGPDGKLYYSIGDRGYNVTTSDGRTLTEPGRGAVFRCNPDGSELEVVYHGLRNPQELAFDQYGNLFTGDNNSDAGDQARFVYLLEGGDSGWNMGYQYMEGDYVRGPWTAEKLWYPQFAGQAAWILPPLKWVGAGPSGLVYYPGVGLDDRYADSFFLCDFRGESSLSSIRNLKVKPKGAGFEVVDEEIFFDNILATDVTFGYDGKIYALDWIFGWEGTGAGRIYTVHDPKHVGTPAVQEVTRLFAKGFAKQTDDKLLALLSHVDIRVRQRAQFALADRGRGSIEPLARIAASHDNQLARLHAIWGLGQIGRKHSEAIAPLLPLLTDEDDHVRSQAAKVLGEGGQTAAAEPLIEMLADPSVRIRMFAAMALGKLGHKPAIEPLLEVLAQNKDRDPFLRHAAVMGLTWIGDAGAVAAHMDHESPSVRMGVLLALRRFKDPRIARFLEDQDPLIVVEAARAIHDVPIPEASSALAGYLEKYISSQHPIRDEALLRRVLNANLRAGGDENIRRLIAFAAADQNPTEMRREALAILRDWALPPPLDRVLGTWRPLESRDREVVAAALRPVLANIVASGGRPGVEAAKLAADYEIEEVGPAVYAMLQDKSRPGKTRAEALESLAALNHEHLDKAAHAALTDDDAYVRAAARDVITKLEPAEGVNLLERAIYEGQLVERQRALATLSGEALPQATEAIVGAFDKLLAGAIPLDTQLDVLLAARIKRDSRVLREKLRQYASNLGSDDPMVTYRIALAGGNAERGREIFFTATNAACVRCHKVGDTGGEVGPELTRIAAEKNREYLLEAIVAPNRTVAKGFETIVLATDDGTVHAGIIREETDDQIVMITPDAEIITVKKDRIEARKNGKSPMPEDIRTQLSERDLRDLIEFLSELK